MLRLHYAPRTRSLRVRWLLEELELPHELIRKEFDPPTAGYSQDTPTGKFPVLEDGDLLIGESGAIVEYVVERYGQGRLAPAIGDPLRGRYLEWMHACEGTYGAALGPVIYHTRYVPDADPDGKLVELWSGRARRTLDVAEAHLADRAYILDDDFSAADVMFGYTVAVAQIMGVLGDRFPKLEAYFGRLMARPAFQRAVAD